MKRAGDDDLKLRSCDRSQIGANIAYKRHFSVIGWTFSPIFTIIAPYFQVRGNTRIGKLAKIEYCPRNGKEA